MTSTTFRVYCDMETDKGGWILVYSYNFTKYNTFNSRSNAVTPRPNWPASEANVPISTSPPLSELSLGAVDWNLWPSIGNEFMIKSNINHWITCKQRVGCIVEKKDGTIECKIIKSVATSKCLDVIPETLKWNSRGPYLRASGIFYYFDGDIAENWPTHDPCGKNEPNQKTGVSNPGGQIYLR